MYKYLVILTTLCLLAGCSVNSLKSSGGRESSSEIKLDIVKRKLDNGLTVLLLKNGHLPIFSYYTFVKVGGKNEKESETGSTHFLEHMMFRGAKKYGPNAFDHLIEANGGSSNAYTTSDLTVYYENLPTQSLDLLVDMEADRMANLLLEPKAFEREKQVILEERKMRYENSARGQMYIKMMEKTMHGTPYSIPVIGTVSDIKNLSRDQMLEYFKTYYAPNNTVVVVVGDIDIEKTFDLIEEKYSSIKASEKLEKLKAEREKEEIYQSKAKWGRSYYLKGQSPLPIFSMVFQGDKIGSRKSFVLDILSSIIGSGESSYLSKKYLHTRYPKLTSIYAYNYGLVYNGLFVVGGQMRSTKSLKKFAGDLRKSLGLACVEAITERTLQKTKNQFMIDYYSSLDSNSGLASFIGNREIYYGDPYFYQKEIDIYQSITIEEVKQACNEVIRKTRPIYLNIWKNNKG